MARKKVVEQSEESLALEQRMREENFFFIEKDYHIPGWQEPEGNAQITMLFDEDGLSIDVADKASNLPVFKIRLDKDKTLQVLSRYARTYCNMETYNLDKVGKKMRMATFYVNLGKVEWRDKKAARQKVLLCCPHEWQPDMYFDSQDSFFSFEGNEWVKTTIRRWD